jgi:DNA polymerase-3 subunit epsilon
VGEAVALLRPRRAGRARRPTVRPPGARASGLDFSGLPDGPGVYLFRDAAGRPLYVGKSTAIRTRARSHFAPGAEAGAWIAQAALVDHRSTGSELGALVLENRLIKRLRPPGNVALTRVDGVVFVRCRLDIPFPVLEVARDPAAGHAVTVGPLRGRAAAAELVEQLTSLWGLRHCGRGLRRREWPSAYGQMGRCLSPCLGDLDPNLYRRRLDEALALFAGRDDARAALLAHLDREMRAAAADRRFERAAWLRRRRERLRVLLDRLGGVLQATHARPRLVVAAAPGAARPDVLWLVEGRVADWGPLPDDPAELHARTLAALRRRAPQALSAHVPAAEVDEVRIVTGWLAAHEPPALALDDGPPPDAGTLHAWARTATAGAQPRSATALPRSAAAAAQPRSRPLQGAGRPARPAQPRDARAT